MSEKHLGTLLDRQIEEYLKYCEDEKNITKQTMRGLVWTLRDFQRKIPVDDLSKVTEDHINEWLQKQIESGCSGRTVNCRFIMLRPMINYYRDCGLAIPIRLKKVKKYLELPPRQVFYTAEEIDKVLACCDPLEWLLIKITFDAGLRISELTNLRLSEINDRRLNYIGKGRKPRESYISPEARERLDKWISANRVTDHLWVKSWGGRYNVDGIRNIMRRPFHFCGYKNFYPHALRHSFATDGQLKGASLLESKDMLGHSKVETTERYLHALQGHLQTVFDKYKFGIEPVAEVQPRKTSNLDDGAVNFMRRLAEEFAAVAQ